MNTNFKINDVDVSEINGVYKGDASNPAVLAEAAYFPNPIKWQSADGSEIKDFASLTGKVFRKGWGYGYDIPLHINNKPVVDSLPFCDLVSKNSFPSKPLEVWNSFSSGDFILSRNSSTGQISINGSNLTLPSGYTSKAIFLELAAAGASGADSNLTYSVGGGGGGGWAVFLLDLEAAPEQLLIHVPGCIQCPSSGVEESSGVTLSGQCFSDHAIVTKNLDPSKLSVKQWMYMENESNYLHRYHNRDTSDWLYSVNAGRSGARSTKSGTVYVGGTYAKHNDTSCMKLIAYAQGGSGSPAVNNGGSFKRATIIQNPNREVWFDSIDSADRPGGGNPEGKGGGGGGGYGGRGGNGGGANSRRNGENGQGYCAGGGGAGNYISGGKSGWGGNGFARIYAIKLDDGGGIWH